MVRQARLAFLDQVWIWGWTVVGFGFGGVVGFATAGLLACLVGLAAGSALGQIFGRWGPDMLMFALEIAQSL